MTLKEKAFENIVGKGEILVTSILPFPTMFSTLPCTNFSFSFIFILLPANAFNFGWSKILLSGQELNPLHESSKLHFVNNSLLVREIYRQAGRACRLFFLSELRKKTNTHSVHSLIIVVCHL